MAREKSRSGMALSRISFGILQVAPVYPAKGFQRFCLTGLTAQGDIVIEMTLNYRTGTWGDDEGTIRR